MSNLPLATSAIDFNLKSYTRSSSKGKPIEFSQVSVSQLLGRDYLFLDFSERTQPKDEKDFYSAVEALIEDLGLSPNETLVVGVVQGLDENEFARFDFTWLSNKIRRHELVEIKSPEQNSFMQMIWQCTSPIPC